jgi:DNA-binding NtrC family response regulator
VSKKPNTVERPRILVLDEPTSAVLALASTLERHGYRVHQTARPEEAVASMQSGACEVVLGEVELAAEAVLAEARRAEGSPPLIVLEDFAATAPPAEGVFDVLARPVSDEDVLRSVRRALESQALRRENARLRAALDGPAGAEPGDFGGLASRDARMQRVFATLASVADSSATLLLTGESGTGKTQLAHAVHRHSARRGRPFVEVNCAALPAALLESELFGHVRGAFTGAVRDRVGKFEQAAEGTLFLDEIGTAPRELQLKLLRVLEEGRFERVGDTRTRTSAARVIVATNVDLAAEVQAGRFRADLFYRIHVVALEVPPLRERLADVPLLAARFCARFARQHGRDVRAVGASALASLCAHAWPGNVRELENCLERAVLVAAGPELEPRDLWPEGPAAPPVPTAAPGFEGWEAGPPADLKAALEGPERWLLRRALEAHGGRRSAAARALGVNRTTLFNKMRKYGLLSFPVAPPGGPADRRR